MALYVGDVVDGDRPGQDDSKQALEAPTIWRWPKGVADSLTVRTVSLLNGR